MTKLQLCEFCRLFMKSNEKEILDFLLSKRDAQYDKRIIPQQAGKYYSALTRQG